MSIKISELPVASSVNSADIVPIVQDGTTKQAQAEMFKPQIETVINSSSTNNKPVGAKAVYDYSAPIKHDSETQEYGVATTTKYGHTKIIDSLDSSSYQVGESLSAYQGAVLKQSIDSINDDIGSITDELATKQTISNMTNKLDENSTSTQYPNAQVTFEKYNELLNQIPTATATGNPINVQDSSNLPIVDFKLKGNCGKNLTIKNIKGYFSSGATKINVDNASESFVFYAVQGITYTFSSLETMNRSTVAKVDTLDIVNNTPISNERNVTNTFTSEFTGYCLIYVNSTLNDNIKNSFQVEKGSTATAYEPYKAVTGDNTVNVLGKNLFDTTLIDRTGRGLTFKGDNTGNVSVTGTTTSAGDIAVLGQTQFLSLWAGTYTISISNTLPYSLKFACRGENDTNVAYFGITAGNTSANFTLSSKLVFFRIYFDTIPSGTSTGWNFKLMIRHSTESASFEPYTEQTQLLSLGDIQLAPTDEIGLVNNVWCVNETPITDTTLIGQLENVLKMHTNKNVTNISIVPTGTNAEPTAEVEYRVDLGTVIGNINNAIISLGGNV